MAEASGLKVLAMGALAFVAIILAIVVAVKTFSDPSGPNIKPATEPITGTWNLKEGPDAAEQPPGAPVEYLIVKGLTSFDASNATSAGGTLHLTYADGRKIDGKVLEANPGQMMVQIPLKNGKFSQLTVAQMGEGGPTIVSDGIMTLQFEQAK